MPCAPFDRPLADAPGASTPRRTPRRPARWWLAGLLVGCLLPAGLSHADGLRHAERIVQICILAPALIRARSRLQARRCALAHWPLEPAHRPLASPPRRLFQISRRRATAAHDVLTRRGPPAWAS